MNLSGLSISPLLLSDDSLIGEFLCHELKLGIPVFAKAADERLLQELVDGEVLFLSFEDGHLAHVPSVVVEGAVGPILTHADGIEVTRYGLVERHAALSVGTLDGAIAASSLVVAGEHAVLAIDDRGHEFSTTIVVGDALFVDDFAGLGQ